MITMSDEEQKGLTGFFSRFGSAKKQTVSEEEIKDIVADNDELADDEKRMIHDIIDLGDMSVHEIMQPRVDMIMVEDTETVRTAVERMHGTGYSRLPIFHEDADHIIGIVHYKNLVGPLIDGREDDLAAKYAFEPLFVPETKDIFPLLKEMQTNRQQMAIVVDAYGGTDIAFTTNMAEYIDADVPRVEEKPSRWVHYGMTSSDLGDICAFPTRRLGCIDIILADVKQLGETCKRRAFEFQNTRAGRTHGIHAEPMTFGMLGSWHILSALRRVSSRHARLPRRAPSRARSARIPPLTRSSSSTYARSWALRLTRFRPRCSRATAMRRSCARSHAPRRRSSRSPCRCACSSSPT